MDSDLTPYTKVNSKRIKDLNVGAEAVKTEENAGVNLCDLELGKDFLDMTPEAQMTKDSNWTASK